jgi:hypothetical protein
MFEINQYNILKFAKEALQYMETDKSPPGHKLSRAKMTGRTKNIS